MARPKQPKKGSGDPLDAYRRIRKPVAPAERVDEDRRRKLEEREADRRIRERE